VKNSAKRDLGVGIKEQGWREAKTWRVKRVPSCLGGLGWYFKWKVARSEVF